MTRRPRARDLGVAFDGAPGEHNAITDVHGVTVGHHTRIVGDAIRTGVTAIFPRGATSKDPVFAAWYPLNGNGELTGTTWIDESGFLEGPVMLTNTHSVGLVRDAVVAWQVEHGLLFQPYSYPVVGETYDGLLNDINGQHIHREHVLAAISAASSAPPAEGNVGGGTGMVCFKYKGGIGTSSRRVGEHTVGALVQANFGLRHQLQIVGIPVGRELPLPVPTPTGEQGSIIVVIATDAPLLPHQLRRLARRAPLGLARTGGAAGNGSGDIMLAFSTANPGAASPDLAVADLEMLPNQHITPLFDATICATEEAIINALVAAETMTGNGHTFESLPHDRLRELLTRYQPRR